MVKGKFIVIDGIDGSGKATQTMLLAEKLGAVHWAFPQYGKNMFADMVEAYLHGKHGNPDPFYASLPYVLDRLMARDDMIWKMEHQGKTIVCDRWVSANKMHQCARMHKEAVDRHEFDLFVFADKEDFFGFIDQMEYDMLKLPVPDVSIFLDVNPQQAVKNTQKRNEDVGKAPVDFHEELRHLELAREAALDMVECDKKKGRKWIVIECCNEEGNMLSIEEIHIRICKALWI